MTKFFQVYPDKSTFKQRFTVVLNTILGLPIYYTVTDEEIERFVKLWTK